MAIFNSHVSLPEGKSINDFYAKNWSKIPTWQSRQGFGFCFFHQGLFEAKVAEEQNQQTQQASQHAEQVEAHELHPEMGKSQDGRCVFGEKTRKKHGIIMGIQYINVVEYV